MKVMKNIGILFALFDLKKSKCQIDQRRVMDFHKSLLMKPPPSINISAIAFQAISKLSITKCITYFKLDTHILTLFYEGGGQFCPASKSYSHNFKLNKFTQKRYQICARNLFS